MRLFLIRHGETVDNVAGLYAGTRDSALTSHGVLQARRLASHFAESGVVVGRIFSSDLQRAVKTAEAIVEASRCAARETRDLAVVQLPELREKDFGSGEGVSFGGRRKPGGRRKHEGAESVDDMRERAHRFVRDHFLPVARLHADDDNYSFVVVSHGIFLGVLFKALCEHTPTSGRVVPPDPQRTIPAFDVELYPVFPPWSNTGYLECTASMARDDDSPLDKPLAKLKICKFNSVSHLDGLKKTRGGIGSAQFDARQKTMDSFFAPSPKNRKLDAQPAIGGGNASPKCTLTWTWTDLSIPSTDVDAIFVAEPQS